MTQLICAIVVLVIALFILIRIFPTKKDVKEISQEIVYKQDKQTKMITDMRNVFFSKTRKSRKKGGK